MPHNTQDDERVMALVEMALASPPAERRSFLKSLCAGDSHLFDEAWDCVQWEQRMSGFLEEPPYPRPDSPEHPFQPGELLEGRFRIVREVAQGGMGVVYEAFDEKLQRRVAIKCAKTGFGRQLPPEVRHASEISHPNVCKFYEIHTASTGHGDIDFLTMEYLEGETLTERLSRGPMPRTEARQIARQICAGLAEAHRMRVIHGDLKTGNVIVTKGAGGSLRAVITDFGLARKPESSQQAVVSGPRGGTPDYMAPELWIGERPSVASDIYALGVILKQLAPADHLMRRVATHCLQEQPPRRPRDADAVARALAPLTRRRLLAATAVAIVAAISGVATYRVASAPKETIRLAVLPFQAAPPAPRLTEIQSQTARRIAALTGGPSKKFSVILPTDAVRRQVFTGAQARAVFSATHALQAAFRDDAGHLLLHARIIDAGSGGSAKEWHARYAPSELRYIPTALAGVVTGTFHLPVAANSPNVNARAKDDYLAGVEALRRDSGADVALTHMERAVAADPDSAVTHAGLAEARRMKYATANDRSWLGRVQESLREAERRNPDLPEVRLIAGWMLAEAGRYQQAVAEYLRCIELAPANGDAYRRLGMAYRGNDQPEQALAAHRRAIQVDSKYWRNFEALGNFHLRRGEYSEAVESLSGAVERAPAEPGARRLLAQAYSDLGRFSEAETELRTALALEESWDSLQTLSVVLLNQGQDREAIPFIMRAIELRPQSHLSWISLGMAHQRLGMRAKAEWANQRGLELAEKEMQKNARNGYVRSCLAYLCARLGNQTRADSEITQALQLAQKDSHVLWMAMLTYEALGRRDDAFAVLKEAPRGVLEDVSRSPDFADLRHDPRFQKLLLTLDQGK